MNIPISSRWRWSLSLLVCLVVPVVVARGEDDPTAEQKQAMESAQRVWNVLEAVLEHHVQPPTRQQMLQSAMNSLAMQQPRDAAGLNNQLARDISNLEGRGQTEQFVARQLMAASAANNPNRLHLENTFIAFALQAVPGGANYIPAKESAVQQQVMDNRYVGIGIAMSMVDDYPTMQKVIPRGPANRAGAKDGDLMVKIDGEDTKGMPLEAVIPKLRGNAGIPVSVVVRQVNSDETRTLRIVRGEVPFETILGFNRNPDLDWDHAVGSANDVAYIKIASIRGSVVSDLRETARKLHLKGFRALIVDLRGMEAGELRHAAMLADQFLDKGSVGFTVVRGKREEIRSNEDSLFGGWPIAVLIDATTVGQAEWIAAGLQERQNTVLMGSNTRGLGYVTERIKLPDGAAIDLRTGTFLRPNGRSLVSRGEGLSPQFVFQNALQFLGKSNRARFPVEWNGVSPDLTVGQDPIASAAAHLRERIANTSS